MKRADARVDAVTEHEPNDEQPKEDVFVVDEIEGTEEPDEWLAWVKRELAAGRYPGLPIQDDEPEAEGAAEPWPKGSFEEWAEREIAAGRDPCIREDDPEKEPNEEPRKDEDVSVDEIPSHCGHILVDEEGREVDYWPRFPLREEE